jgi:acyl-CoA thioester hydrolase
MYTAETQIRVRYAETDKMGYVYYGNYAMYYEVARVEALRSLGFVYRELEEMGIMMPVIESKFRYLKPAVYDELLTLKVTVPTLPAARILFTYEITNDRQELINTGETTLVFIDMASGRPKRIPEVLHKLFTPYFS